MAGMGIADEKLAEAEDMQAMVDSIKEFAVQRLRAADQGAPRLWEMLQSAIENEVKTFASKWPKASTLAAYRDNNKITVQTQHFPVVKLQLTRSDGWIEIVCTGMRRGTAEEEQLLTTAFEFYADQELNPCFVDGTLTLAPDQVVREAQSHSLIS